jgi:hypothetical protein
VRRCKEKRKVEQDPKIDSLDGSERVFIALDLFRITPGHHHRSEPEFQNDTSHFIPCFDRSVSTLLTEKGGRGTDPMAPT